MLHVSVIVYCITEEWRAKNIWLWTLDSGLSTLSTSGRKIVSFDFSPLFPLADCTMNPTTHSFDLDEMHAYLQEAVEGEKITPNAQEHISRKRLPIATL